MWPFSRPKEADGVGDRLTTALRRLDDVESSVRLLKTEWLDTLDRLERIAGRLAKRAERDGRLLTAPPEEPSTTGAERPAAPASRALAQVMKRRAVRLLPGSG